MVDAAARIGAFDGLEPFGKTGRFMLEPLPFMARFNFRGSEAAAHDLGLQLGVELSRIALRANETSDGRAALWLGPDEWELIGPLGDYEAIKSTVERVVVEPHSLVDVSHRNAGVLVRGARIEAVLNAAVALDLDISAFPVGMCTRTLLGKCEVVLWRKAVDTFHIECFRSFVPYVHAYLYEAAREYIA
jgi:sarcosine oxidase subunit gamma